MRARALHILIAGLTVGGVLANTPVHVFASAPDGSGTLTTPTTSVANGSTGNTIVLTYTATTGGTNHGAVTAVVPPGWTAPSTTASNAGYTTASTGTVSVASQTITVSSVTLAANATLTITYGSKASSGPGSTATTAAGAMTWQAQEKSTNGGTLTNLGASPSITVLSANGSGTLTTTTTSIAYGSTGNTLTFTYTAATGGTSSGAVTVVAPTGWGAPSLTGPNAGYTTASTGTASVASQTITVSSVTLAANATLTITYGSKVSSGPGATAPSTAGAATWQAQEKSTSGGTLTNLGSSPSITVLSADGSGTLTTTTANVANGSTGNTIPFTYTAATGGTSSGSLTVVVPTGWSPPALTGTDAGYTTASTGTVSVASQTITVSSVSLAANATLTITYGSKAASGPGAISPATAGAATWQAQEKSSGGGTLTNVATSPSITVLAPDASGALTTPTASVANGSTGNTITFTYTAATGGMSNGAVTVVVPSGWNAPSLTGANAGYTTASTGVVSVASQTITVSPVTLAANATLTITYGSRASSGPGATSPTTGGAASWTTQEKSSSAGMLGNIASPPTITVLSPDGYGSLLSSPTSVADGSSGNTLSLTYTATLGGLSNGSITVVVPTGWSAPSTAGSSAGYTAADSGTVSVAGGTITVSGVTLGGGATLTVTYGSKASSGPGATAPASPGTATWQAQEKSSSGGTLTNLASSPTISVLSADGSGTLTPSTYTVGYGSTGNTISFTYTAATGGTSSGGVTVVVPTGWSAPSLTGSNAGYTTASTGTVSVTSQTITVSAVTLSAGVPVTIIYGSTASGGPGATAPPTAGVATWQGQEKSFSGGTLTNLGSSPSINVLTVYATAVWDDGPTVYYRLGEAGGTTATDTSGHGVMGTFASSGITYGVTGAISGDSDTAITTAAAGAAVTASASSLPSGSSARTVELWEKTTAVGRQTFLSYGNYGATGDAFMVMMTSGTQLFFDASNDAASFNLPYAINDGNAHHIVLTYDGSTAMTAFLDGQQVGTAALPRILTTTLQGLEVGNGPEAGAFTGTLDEVAVYATTLTPTQVNTHWQKGVAAAACASVPTTGYAGAVASDSPTRYFRLGESSGPAVLDYSGNCRDAAYAPGAGHVSGLLTGDSNGAVGNPTPVGTIVSGSTDGLPSGSSARTVEFWEKTITVGSQTFLSYGNYGPTGDAFMVMMTSGTRLFFDASNDAAAFNLPYAINDGNAHHVVLTYDGSTAMMAFLDGQQVGTAVLPNALSTTLDVQGLEIGNGPEAGAFTGTLDEVAVYATTLTPTQINTHWQKGVAAAACASVPTTGYAGAVASDSPTRYFRLGETSGSAALDYSGNCRDAAYAPGAGHVSGLLTGDSNGAVGNPTPVGTIVSASTDGLPAGPSARTVEFWEKTTTVGSQTFLSYGNYGPTGDAFMVMTTSGTQLFFDASNDAAAFNLPYAINDGNAHHVVLTYDGSTAMTAFLDGQQVGTAVLAHPLSTTLDVQGLEIGNGPEAGAFTGTLDEVAVYATTLTPNQVNTHWQKGVAAAACVSVPTTGYAGAVASNSPTRFFRLTESSGQAALDYSGNCRDAAYAYGVTHGNGGIVSEISSAVNSPSTSGTIVSASADGLPSGSSARSIEIWEKTTTVGSQTFLSYGNYGPTGDAFMVMMTSGTQLFFDASNDAAAFNLPYAINDGSWHQIAMAFDGSTSLTGYLDGQQVGTAVLAHPLSTTLDVQGLEIGNGPEAGAFTGTLDDMSIYPTQLSAAGIVAHYNAGAPVGGPFAASEGWGGGENYCIPCRAARHGNATSSPVDTATGNFWHSFTDVSISGRGYGLSFSRTYNSGRASTLGPVGYGWSTNYQASLSCSGTTATVTQENGSVATFTTTGTCSSGAWTPSKPRYIATLSLSGGAWTLTRLAQQTLTFNSSGQLTSLKDLNGYTTSLTYSSGLLSTATDPSGRTLSFVWTTSGGNTVISTITDANISPSRVVTFAYDTGANLTSVTDVNSGTTTFAYDTGHRMTSMRDPNCYSAGSGCNAGNGVQNHYDTSGRIDWQKDQLGRQTSFDYTSISGGTKITDPAGHVQVDYYTDGVRTAVTKGYSTSAAATWFYAYDPATLMPVAIQDANGNVTTDTYDSSGNLLTETDALNRTTSYTYNSFNQVLTVQDPVGTTTTTTYDSNGNLTQTSTPLTGTSDHQVFAYHHADSGHPGDVTSVDDPDSKTTTFTYDSNGDRASSTDPLNNETTRTYNADGWLVSTVAPKGNVSGCGCAAAYTTTDSYIIPGGSNTDEFGDVQTVTDSLGHVTTIGYDLNRQKTSIKDGLGNTTTFVYDLGGEQTQVDRPDTINLATTYYADGTVHQQKDGKNNSILTYTYDSLARVSSMADALGNTTSYTYDRDGNTLTKLDPISGATCTGTPIGCTTYSQDADNELQTVTNSDGTTPNITSTTYDADGQRTGMTDGTGTSTWSWDSLHRLISYRNGNGDTVGYAYNLRDLPTIITYPGGHNVTESYDSAGHWTSTQDWNSKTTNYGYDENSNLTTETMPTTGTNVVDTLAYNNADQLTNISSDQGGTNIWHATYGRDSDGQLSTDTSATSNQTNFKYNSLNRTCYAGSGTSNACASPPASAQPFAFDAADNLTALGGTTLQFNSADQLCWMYSASSGNPCGSAPSGATTYGYDTRGNRTSQVASSGSAVCDSYDQASRLSNVETGTGSSCSSPTIVATYAYNGDGLRMSKMVSGTTTQQAWDISGALPLIIKDGSTYYVNGPAGLPLEQINGSTTLWYHRDQIGSTRAITDGSGTAKATYTFDPYGNVTACTGARVTVSGSNVCTGITSVANPFMFAGQYRDDETGLLYLRARYYDPITAQFFSRDPMVATTRSPYGYVAGNPLNHTDASGRWFGVDDFIATVGGAVVGAAVSAVTQQITTGHIDLGKVGIDAAAGALTGEVSLYAGPVAGGLAGGFVDNFATQVQQHHGLNNFNPGELAFDTAAGGLLGKGGDYLFDTVGAANPATWGALGYRAAMSCVRFGGGDLTTGGLNAAFGAPLGGVLGGGFEIGSDRLHRGFFGE